MKKNIFIILLLLSICNVSAQNIYPIFMTSLKDINKYIYYNKNDLKEMINIPEKVSKKQRNTYREISKAFISAGFTFNVANDTLLFVFMYANHAPFVPHYSYAQSSTSKISLKNDSNGKGFIQLTPVDKYSYNYFSLLYLGNIDRFRELFLKKGESVGNNIALRILIRNGKVVGTSYLWEYNDIIEAP